MTILFLFLVVVSMLFKLFPPKKINYFYGYRTPRSMKNIENWNLANRYSATLMLIVTAILLMISLILDFIKFEAHTLLIGLLVFSFAMLLYSTEKKMKDGEVM